ncbi:MAG: helix-turn-helix transcriptional regulator [Pirellulales bacterium]|nr:helix-turn-helix transcriptional regulator [Pirellulales bacterium]
MSDHASANLARLMAAAGLSVQDAAERTGVDQRTIRGILSGTQKAHSRTLHRLAEGLRVSVDEFFLDPVHLLYRRFDRWTNPLVEEVIEEHPEWFDHWTEADFDELHSHIGAGGPLTREGVAQVAERINRKRCLHEKLDVLMESSHAEVAGGILDLLYEKIAVVDP